MILEGREIGSGLDSTLLRDNFDRPSIAPGFVSGSL